MNIQVDLPERSRNYSRDRTKSRIFLRGKSDTKFHRSENAVDKSSDWLVDIEPDGVERDFQRYELAVQQSKRHEVNLFGCEFRDSRQFDPGIWTRKRRGRKNPPRRLS
jgi:hypothetical protein